MERVLEIATKVSTPIAVAGLALGVLLIIFYGILKLKIFPKLNQTMGKDLLSSMMYYLYRLALVSLVLGFIAYLTPVILAAVFPQRVVPPDSAEWTVKYDYTLKQAIERVAQMGRRQVDIQKCSDTVMNIPIKKGTYRGTDHSDIMYQLQRSLDTPVPVVAPGKDIYTVRVDERGFYEVICQN